MELYEIEDIVAQVTYKPGWSLVVNSEPMQEGGRAYLQISVDETSEAAVCPLTGKIEPWKSGKKYLSYHMCRQEIVGACLGAIKDAEMHEIHEWFKYKGRAIYNPHLDPDKLVEFAVLSNMNMRANAMSMEEN